MANLYQGDIHYITSTITDVDSVKIEISYDNKETWTTIADNVPIFHATVGDQEVYQPLAYPWTVTGLGTQCYFRVSGTGDDSDIVDDSDTSFAVMRNIKIGSIDLDTITINFSVATDASGKTVTIDGVSATVNSQSENHITFTPAEPLDTTTKVYTVRVSLSDGTYKDFTFTYNTRVAAGSIRMGLSSSISMAV